MAPGLYVIDNLGNEYAGFVWFTSDSKMLCELLMDKAIFKVIEQTYHLDVRPLIEIVHDALPDAYQAIYTSWDEYRAAMWHDLQAFELCLTSLLALLQSDQHSYHLLEEARQNSGTETLNYDTFEDTYFVDGFFINDLSDLLKIIRHAKSQGATRIQLQAV
jgi:hypothetical protein